mmetsp:Transcript_24878/g.41451  ORF Transcript_24878/g.41451 Transcript_24878/m.41451 type:complete len:586 (+) Transcript_24878:68-1825(+)
MIILVQFISLLALLSTTPRVLSFRLPLQLERSRSCSKTKLNNNNVSGNMGSDALVRPDDEDSPEFKQYLRQLLVMQANRAKTGFGAPSSGSSDAYIAKLSRLKVEKMARFRAGLPDDDLDYSYKPEDYVNAIYEGRDVPVSNTQLSIDSAMGSGSASGGGGKVRGLTAEERRSMELAEESVRKALEARAAANIPAGDHQQDSSASKPRPASMSEEEKQTFDMIGNILDKKNPIAAYTTKDDDAGATTNAAPVSPVSVAATVEPAPAMPVAAASVPATEPSAVKEGAPKLPRAPSSAAAGSGASSTAGSKTLLLRKLPKEELDVVGKAMQLAVMHRGGGPFGPGRLKGAELRELDESLRAAYVLLCADSAQAVPGVVVDEKSKAAIEAKEKKESLPRLKKVAAVQSKKKEEEVADPIAPAVAAPQSAPAASQPQQQVSIAQGLNEFLQQPGGKSMEELESLRDGLVQCLSMIDQTIMSGPAAAAAPNVNGNTNTISSSTGAPTTTDRMVGTYFDASSTTAATDAAAADAAAEAEVERELKLALGLLLKHRGGPGFGHGRLQGKELAMLEQSLRKAASRFSFELSEA